MILCLSLNNPLHLQCKTNKRPSPKEVCGGKLLPYPSFSGRRKQLEDLQRKFHLEDDVKTPATVAICGFGGVGKSTLARQYAALSQEVYTGGIFLFPSDDQENFSSTLQSLSMSAHIDSRKQGKQIPLHTILIDILKWLDENSEPWLLILDNYDDFENFELPLKLILNRGEWSTYNSMCHVLVTTRRSVDTVNNHVSSIHSKLSTLKLCPFKVEESLEFLRCCLRGTESNTIDKQEEQLYQRMLDKERDPNNYLAARALCEHDLGNLPLALEQMVVFLKFNHGSVNFIDYRVEFKKVKANLFHGCPGKPGLTRAKERLTVSTTWNMNFEFIRQYRDSEDKDSQLIASVALKTMGILTFFHHHMIPVGIIKCVLELSGEENATPHNVFKVEKLLQEFSLLQRDQTAPNRYFAIHQLIQVVVRDHMLSPPQRGVADLVFSEAIQCLRKLTRMEFGSDFEDDDDDDVANAAEITSTSTDDESKKSLPFAAQISEAFDTLHPLKTRPFYLHSRTMIEQMSDIKPPDKDFQWLCQFTNVLTLYIFQLPVEHFKNAVRKV